MDHLDPIQVTRQDLYDQIWSTPVSQACRTYGLSDVGLAKICAQWNIPRPPRGYWAKQRNGQSVRKKKLPPIDEGNPVVFSYRPAQPGEPSEKTSQNGDSKSAPTDADRQRAFEKQPENLIAVSEQLVEPHFLVVKTGTSIRGATPDDRGIVRPKAQRCLDLAVSPPLIERSLRILDAILKALEKRGLAVFVTGDDPSQTRARVLEEAIGFRLFEETVRQERLPTPHEIEWEIQWNPNRKFYSIVPSGKLVLEITSGAGLQRCWTDRSDRCVEQFLNSFVVGLYRAAESIKQDRAAAERRKREEQEREIRRQEEETRRQKERKEQERQRQEAEQLRRVEESRIQKLAAEVDAWKTAHDIRAYVAAIRAVQSASDLRSEALEKWLNWAEDHADQIDPLERVRRILDDRAAPSDQASHK